MDETPRAGDAFDATFRPLLGHMRPKLHRYCARMTGSMIDGEDVLQEALTKAVEAFPVSAPLDNPEGWLFRVAHNAALDFLRRRKRIKMHEIAQEPEMSAELSSDAERRTLAAASLRTFMQLPVRERGSVILMDVLGYSLREISAITEMSIPTIKALLHRGRAQLRVSAASPSEIPLPVLSPEERERLIFYVDCFNARDFESLRNRLAEDVKAELVGQTAMQGRREVASYFGNYASDTRWRIEAGVVEGKAVALVFESGVHTSGPGYIVILRWDGENLIEIRDFRYARYVIDDAEIQQLSPASNGK